MLCGSVNCGIAVQLTIQCPRLLAVTPSSAVPGTVGVNAETMNDATRTRTRTVRAATAPGPHMDRLLLTARLLPRTSKPTDALEALPDAAIRHGVQGYERAAAQARRQRYA